MKTTSFKIGNRSIGGNNPVFIIAELSANHNHDFDVALQSVKAMKECGVDAVKLQTYTPDTITIDCDNKYFQIKHGTLWDGQTLYKLYQKAYTPWDWQPKLKEYAEKLGLICFSTPFDYSAVDFLEKMKVQAYKFASFEITDTPLLHYVASKKKPLIISTGIATLDDIKLAIETCRKAGNRKIAILKCTSEYPAPPEEANLRTIPDLAKRFGVVAGLSDHTLGIAASVAAVALGAKIIEKHFIYDRTMGGPDCAFSLEPAEFAQMVKEIRFVEKALGKVTYSLSPKVKKSRNFSRSLFVVKDVRKGEKFTTENVRSIRPGYGMHPKYLDKTIGKNALKDITRGTPMKWGFVDR